MTALKNTLGDTNNIATPTADRELSSLRERASLIQRFKADRAASHAAGSALKMVQTEQVNSQANIALTTLKLAEAKIRTSLVADSMKVIGAVTVRLNTVTKAVDQALQGTAHVGMFATMVARQESRTLFEDLQRTGAISAEERGVLCGLVEQDAADDIQRLRARTAEAKRAIDGLHSFAQQGIAEAKDKLL